MVPFSGWEMPVQFSGLINEHMAVRKKVGLFDISHMGVIKLEGENPKDKLQSLVPSDLNRIGPGEACYTVLLNSDGGIIDDLIIYDLGSQNQKHESVLLVINASRTINDLNWLNKHLENKNLTFTNAKENKVFLAIQGPFAKKTLETVLDQSLEGIPRFGHKTLPKNTSHNGNSIFLSRTGYTGEEGFELLLEAEEGKQLWLRLIKEGVIPCGLGARDTLRLEACMHLYGNDLTTKTTPFEAGLGWLIHLEMPSQFIGRNALEQQAKDGIKKRLVGLKLEDRAIARHGYPVLKGNMKVGEVTSGTWSPTLREAIALAYVPAELSELGTLLNVEIRDKIYKAKIVRKPFYQKA